MCCSSLQIAVCVLKHLVSFSLAYQSLTVLGRRRFLHLYLRFSRQKNLTALISNGKRLKFLYNLCLFCNYVFPSAIRFGRMPRSEKAKLKAEILTGENYVEDSEMADLKSLAKRIHDAYLKNFNMNKVKARIILAGKTNNNPVSTFSVT